MNKLMKLAMTGVVAFALTAVAGIAEAASEIRIVNSDPTTGEFTLQFDAAQKNLQLYFAKAGEDDNPAVTDTWRNPLFLRDVPAGETELTVTVPGWTAEGTSRFFLADPDEALVTRHDYLIGGKDSSGYHNSAFVTGLHPNYDWKYEIVYLVPELPNPSYQSWIFCHRQDNSNNGSVIALAVRAEEVMRFAYGPGGDNGRDVRTTNKISANVLYQASIDGRTCVYSNLTAGVEFEKVVADIYTTTFGVNYIFAFGCAANGSSFASNDKCSIARVYSFKAWDGSGALKADYRPIVANNIAGYFDVVSRNFFKAGDGFSNVANTPYVASAETQHVDTLVGHLGEPVAVSSVIGFSPVQCVSESLPFADGSEPAYGNDIAVGVGESVTFSVPTDEFRWTDPTTHAAYRVRSAGLRIDTYDTMAGEFVTGTPQRELRSYTFTRKVMEDGVRVVCLWDAEMLVDAPAGRRANCLRLVSVGTDANGKTVLGEGPFNTGVHPIPAKTRVAFEVGLDNTATAAQDEKMPTGAARQFFGVRDAATDGSNPGIWQNNFQICRFSSSTSLRFDFCNYFDGVKKGDGVLPLGASEHLWFDVNPTFVDVVDDKGNTHRAEQKNTGTERSTTALNGVIYIFGQHRPYDTVSPVSVDYDNTRYYSFTIWEDGEHLTRDYVPCLDVTNAPAFYDRVTKDYLYPIGSAAVYEAEFDEATGANSVQVIGETVDGELAAYLDPDGVQPGYYEIESGKEKTFKATKRKVFDLRVGGYRVDTWVAGTGWVKGAPQTGRSVTLEGDASVRRLVWIWKKANGLVLILK